MPVIKVSLSEENYQELQESAQREKMSIQDYIRTKLLTQNTIFTPEEAVKRALEKYDRGDCFTIPDLYGDDWTMERGIAGVFGKRFFNYIEDGGCKEIEFTGMTNYGRHAQYRMK